MDDAPNWYKVTKKDAIIVEERDDYELNHGEVNPNITNILGPFLLFDLPFLLFFLLLETILFSFY